MSDIERKAFEQWLGDSRYALARPDVVEWFYDVWQAARQAPASGEVEPIGEIDEGDEGAFVDLYPDNTFTIGQKVYTHPPAKVPEGYAKEKLTEALRQFRHNSDNTGSVDKPEHGFVFGYDKAIVDDLVALLTTPTPATTAGTEWVEWFGGDQPVPDGTIVELKLRGGYAGSYPAEKVDWKAAETSFDIISYRVVRPANTPPQEQ